MELRVLGAHNAETATTRLVSLLVDGVIALDAGGLTSGLSLAEQGRVQAILLTHRHYDHVRDIPTFAINTGEGKTTDVYGSASTLEALQTRLLDGLMYPRFHERPSQERPAVRLRLLSPGETVEIAGHRVQAVPVPHTVPSQGYEVEADSRRLFFTGDTGAGLAEALAVLPRKDPDLLVVEVTLPSRMEEQARRTGHLTTSLLAAELAALRRHSALRDLPRILAIHMSPAYVPEIWRELMDIADRTGCTIDMAREGMAVTV